MPALGAEYQGKEVRHGGGREKKLEKRAGKARKRERERENVYDVIHVP